MPLKPKVKPPPLKINLNNISKKKFSGVKIKEEEKPTPQPVKLKKFGRNGKMAIRIPDLGLFDDQQKGRRLLKGFKITDALDFRLISKQDIRYSVYLANITKSSMEIKFTFLNPLAISNEGFDDKIQVIFKDHPLWAEVPDD